MISKNNYPMKNATIRALLAEKKESDDRKQMVKEKKQKKIAAAERRKEKREAELRLIQDKKRSDKCVIQ